MHFRADLSDPGPKYTEINPMHMKQESVLEHTSEVLPIETLFSWTELHKEPPCVRPRAHVIALCKKLGELLLISGHSS